MVACGCRVAGLGARGCLGCSLGCVAHPAVSGGSVTLLVSRASVREWSAVMASAVAASAALVAVALAVVLVLVALVSVLMASATALAARAAALKAVRSVMRLGFGLGLGLG